MRPSSEPSAPENVPVFNIAAVERDTGLTKDTLRVWERRYGFPQPLRDEFDERAYPQEQVEKLRLIRLLIDRGLRPGKLMGLTSAELKALVEGERHELPLPAHLNPILEALLAHAVHRFRESLTQALMKQGLQRFVAETVAPLNNWIGTAWLDGKLQIFGEHLYSEHVQNILRNAIIAQPGAGSAPRVLLTSLPGERHRIGLLMVEAVLAAEGVVCVALGTETPALDIRQAVTAYAVDIVGLSFSAATAQPAALAGLHELRQLLPREVALWGGGGSLVRCRKEIPGVLILQSFDEMLRALASWRAAAARG